MQTIDYWAGTDAGNGGASGTDFVDKNTATGYRGTSLKSGWFNAVQDEIVNAITDSGQNLDELDSNQLKNAIKQFLVLTDKTITVDYVNGDDLTGNFTNSFGTLQGAIDFASKCQIYRNATLTINVNSNCGIRAESTINFSHANGNRVKISALSESSPVNVSSTSYSGSLVTINTSSAHSLAIGDYVLINGVTPANYNMFGKVNTTPTTTQFTISIGSSFTIPAYSSGGTVTKQANVFTFSNTDAFILDGVIGELNMAVHQTGTLSGAAKIGFFVNKNGIVNDGKIMSTGFSYGLLMKSSSVFSADIFCNSNVSNIRLYSSTIKDSKMNGNLCANDNIISDNSTISANEVTVCNSGRYGLNLYKTYFADNTISKIGNNTTFDFVLSACSVCFANGITAISHTSNCVFQTFYTTGSDSRFGCCINS